MTAKKLGLFSGALPLLVALLPACAQQPASLLDQELAAGTAFGPQQTGQTCATGGAGAAASSGTAGGSAIDFDPNLVAPSLGCNQPVPDGQPLAKYGSTPYTMHVTGATLDACFSVPPHDRTYFVWLPADYDNTKPYRVTFLYMGCGDRNAAATATYKMMASAGDKESIYVAVNMPPETVNVNGVDVSLPPIGKPCFDNTIGKQSVEWEAMGLIASQVQKTFCIDENRVFVAGYSSGGWVSNMFGCYFAGKDPNRQFGKDISVRGQTTVTGGPVFPDVPCEGKVAALWIHDTDDHENSIGGNLMTSLPRVLAANGCGAMSAQAPWVTSSTVTAALGVNQGACTQFTDCPAAYPVVFCTTNAQGHASQDNLALPAFIEFQNLLNAK